MKAIEINGKITVYDPLPSSWKGVIGNFSKLSDEEIKAYGFYDVVIPNYDLRIEYLGEIYFDSENQIFKKDVLDKTWAQTLNECKEQIISNFNYEIRMKLQETDWYHIRKLERNIDVPQEVEDERADLLAQFNTVEAEINALTTKKAVMSYNLPNVK